MEKVKLVSNYQIENLIIEAFNQIGNDLGDLLYNIENITLNNCDRKIDMETNNDFLTEELDTILANSYRHLLVNIRFSLKAYEKLYE